MDSDILKYLQFFKEIGVAHIRVVFPELEQHDNTGLIRTQSKPGSAHPQKRPEVDGLPVSPMLPFASLPDQSRRSAAAPPDSVSEMKQAREDLGDCVRCKLHRHRTQIVFGVGNLRAELMFVGEAPGADEDEQGIPFVGRAGQLLTKIIESIGLRREDVYIANIIKCRPPQNRNPEADEIERCLPFLLCQIEVVRPRLICALGKFAAQTLLETNAPITQLRGRFFDRFGAKVIPTFHPSYLLRNPAAKREVWEDMKAVRRVLDERQGT